MPRIAHIINGQIVNVSNGGDDWTPPPDGSQILESEAIAQSMPYAPRETAPIESVSMRSLRFALIDAGLLQSVSDTIAAIPDAIQRSKAEVWWHYSITVSRKHELVSSIGAALNLTDEQVDAIFQDAFNHDNQPGSVS